MSFERLSDPAKQGLQSLEPLTPEQFREIQSVLTDASRERSEIQASHHVAIQAKLTHDLTAALRKMDKTSSTLARWLVWLTFALVILTVVLAWETINRLIP
jgi:hypothetical protein